MKALLIPAALLTLPGGDALRTEYSVEQRLRVDSRTVIEMETTEFSMERDGEPLERGGFGGGQTSTEVRTLSTTDEILELAEGIPTKLRRHFESAQLESVVEFGDQSRENSSDSPLADTVLELYLDDEGDVVASVIDGSEPDDAALLHGHRLSLAVDALLPPGEVTDGDEWDLDGAAILTALGLDVGIFPAPERNDGGAGRGRRGGGRRGGFGAGGGDSSLRLFTLGEWEGKAKFTGEESGADGGQAVIEFEMQSSGEVPEPERGAGGGRRRGGFLDASHPARERLVESTFEIELEGKLTFSLENRRPVLLEVSGTVTTERNTERDAGESTITIHSLREGEFTHRVEIGVE